jgi:hypothetical protein
VETAGRLLIPNLRKQGSGNSNFEAETTERHHSKQRKAWLTGLKVEAKANRRAERLISGRIIRGIYGAFC